MWDKEDVAAAGYLAGWKVVRRLPDPVARPPLPWGGGVARRR